MINSLSTGKQVLMIDKRTAVQRQIGCLSSRNLNVSYRADIWSVDEHCEDQLECIENLKPTNYRIHLTSFAKRMYFESQNPLYPDSVDAVL